MTTGRDSHGWSQVMRDGSWLEFHGLPDGLSEHDLLDGLGRAGVAGKRRAALLSHAPVALVEAEGLRYWVDEEKHVVLVELHDPPSTLPFEKLVEQLGQPEREGAGRYRRFGAMTTEYVYPERGLALTGAESYDDPPAYAPFLAAVQLFAPTDLQGFVVRLGGSDRGGPQL